MTENGRSQAAGLMQSDHAVRADWPSPSERPPTLGSRRPAGLLTTAAEKPASGPLRSAPTQECQGFWGILVTRVIICRCET
jgi:hypothetical protein